MDINKEQIKALFLMRLDESYGWTCQHISKKERELRLAESSPWWSKSHCEPNLADNNILDEVSKLSFESSLLIMSEYEILRNLKSNDVLRNLYEDIEDSTLSRTKKEFERIRVPLAKFEPKKIKGKAAHQGDDGFVHISSSIDGIRFSFDGETHVKRSQYFDVYSLAIDEVIMKLVGSNLIDDEFIRSIAEDPSDLADKMNLTRAKVNSDLSTNEA